VVWTRRSSSVSVVEVMVEGPTKKWSGSKSGSAVVSTKVIVSPVSIVIEPPVNHWDDTIATVEIRMDGSEAMVDGEEKGCSSLMLNTATSGAVRTSTNRIGAAHYGETRDKFISVS